MSNTIIYVIDYAATGRKKKPNMLHRQDCPGPIFTGAPPANWRKATPAELTDLRECKRCQAKVRL